MELETIKQQLIDYMSNNNLTYLRKSNLAEFAYTNNYELEDITNCIEWSVGSGITSFYERINDTKYKRYIIGALTRNNIEEATGLHYCKACCNYSKDILEATDGNKFCCTGCANYAGYYVCGRCGKLHKRYYNDGVLILCESCCKDYASEYNLKKCDCCNKYYKANDLYNVADKNYCRGCASNLNNISCYHGHQNSTRQWRKFILNREKHNYFGYENEFEIKSRTPASIIALGFTQLLKEQGLEDFFLFENDGSLHTGFEAIAQPFTLAWIYANEEKLQKVYDFLLNANCSAEKTTTTGLHIHFSRTALTKDYSLAKIAFLIHNLQYDFVKYSGRKLSELGYTEFNHANSDGAILLKDFKHNYSSNTAIDGSHTDIVNRQHKNTIEIRLFKGTLDLKRIIANIELVNNMIYYVENHTDTQIENVTFKELCLFKKTRYLKQYYYKIFEPNTKIKGVA